MNRTRKKRLQKVAGRIEAMPIAPTVEAAAFERFCATGELPDHQRLAAAVIERALRRRDARGEEHDQAPQPLDQGAAILEMMRVVARLREEEARLEAGGEANVEADVEPRPAPVREQLFHEAVFGPAIVQPAARAALKVLVATGRDVTDPHFLEEITELPDYDSVGLHLLGFPECLAKRPYVAQARRLLDRFAGLRERIDQDDAAWFERLSEAAFAFLVGGELPSDELMREVVLAHGELLGLLQHYCGEGDREVMAAFDRAARATRAERRAALARVQAFAAEGRLVAGTGGFA